MGADQGAGEKRAQGASQQTLFKALPPRLPALMYAEAVWKQMAKKGLAPGSAVDSDRMERMAAELDDAALGRMLFEIAAATAQSKGLDPEGALRRHADGLISDAERRAQKATAHA